jgi:hypothetical protein
VLDIDLNDWADREDFDLRVWPALAMLTKAAMSDGSELERYAAREVMRSLLVDPASSTVRALRSELEAKKILLKEGEIAAIVAELTN